MSVRMNKYITCSPSVFNVPSYNPEPNLVALMMPFSKEFDSVSKAIKTAAETLSLNCKRVDDIWEDSTIIQDIFNLIYKSSIVVCDFTGKNPNVFYEAGIAHLLGRKVIMITQNIDDIPSDLKHHRCLKYFPNDEGLRDLENKLRKRMKTLIGPVRDYVSIPRDDATEIVITRRWYNPRCRSGVIPPLSCESTETMKFQSSHPPTTNQKGKD